MLKNHEIRKIAQNAALGEYLSDWNEKKSFSQLIKFMQNDWFNNEQYQPCEQYEDCGGAWLAEEIQDTYRKLFYQMKEAQIQKAKIADALNAAEGILETLGGDKHTLKVMRQVSNAFIALGKL